MYVYKQELLFVAADPEYSPKDALQLCFEQSLSQGKKEKGVMEKVAAMLKRSYFTRMSSRGLMEIPNIGRWAYAKDGKLLSQAHVRRKLHTYGANQETHS